MKRIICFFIFQLFFSSILFAQKDKTVIEASVAGFFNGLSLIDADTLKFYSTADFLLLEDGQVWNLDTLVNKIMPRKSMNIKRVNAFQFISTEQEGSMAWVSYYNTAEFSRDEKKQTVRWLESAVLKKERGKWRIKMLHSTKLK
jgi:hypothetical protein